MSGEGKDGGGEKSHEPTPKKLEDARRKGDVPKSADLGAAAAYLGLLAALAGFAPDAAAGAGEALAVFLGRADALEGRILGPGGPALSLAMIGGAALALAPLFFIPMAAVAAIYVAQQAVVAAPEKLAFKLSRISLIANAKKKYGPDGLAEFVKSAVKLTLISVVLGIWMWAEADRLAGLSRADAAAVPAEMQRLAVALLSIVAFIAVAIGALDLAWQRFSHARKLRMSFQELKEETKESEGDPHLKGERRRRAQIIASSRMMEEVPAADVVVVNPTHYAVALKWSRRPGTAPECVAKGIDEIALRIREIAEEAGVPLREDPPAARALHAAVEIGEEIPPEHYPEVAAAIRFADKMRAMARERGWRR